MTPAEAYVHLQQILENVNAVTGTLFAGEVISRLDRESEDVTPSADGATSADGVEFEEGLVRCLCLVCVVSPSHN